MKPQYKNMISRWEYLSNMEIHGVGPAAAASVVKSILEDLAEADHIDHLTENQERLLLGFEINTGFGAEDGFRFVHCLDLHTVSATSSIVEALDDYFMCEIKVNGIAYLDRWLPHIKVRR